MTPRFRDRRDAGRQLARALAPYRGAEPIVLALPRGGVVVAAEIASTLDAPLDLVLVRKIGVPEHPELAMGAVVDGEKPVVVRNEDVIALAHVSDPEFDGACARELRMIEQRRERYAVARKHPEIAERTAILVDDGIATGATVRAALRATRRRNPAKLVLAAPVAARDVLARLRAEADDIVCLDACLVLDAVGSRYADFRPVSDQDVVDLLSQITEAPTSDQEHRAK